MRNAFPPSLPDGVIARLEEEEKKSCHHYGELDEEKRKTSVVLTIMAMRCL